ncbi:MAG TPA: DUF4261 domain-containing protein [Thermoanaerobaculia bacterium]|nr:DUF4261 domain-containing protein [Thermoanaerobaculia bacterium]
MTPSDDEAFPPSRRGFQTPYAVDLLFVKPPSGGGAVRAVDHESLVPSLQQSWWWRDAATTVRRCRYALTVAEAGEPDHPPHRERFSKFQRRLASVVEVLDPAALHWNPTQQFIRPANFLEALAEVGFEYPALGALNVRLFAIEGGKNEDMLMDTLGLGALGLWDLQCHFRGLPPDRVATWMLETARAYFLGEKKGIGDRGTIAGPNSGARWRLHAEEALMAPERVLLDVDPGKPYAAGDRG